MCGASGAGRKPTLSVVLDNSKAHKTKAQLEARAAHEPRGCSDALDPPDSLSEAAKNHWERLVGLYRELSVPILNDLDKDILAAYCEAVAIYQEAERKYQGQPLVGYSEGKIVENPYLAIMTREGKNIAKYAEQLCLSPVGRARMGIAKARAEIEDDPMADILQGVKMRGGG